MAPDITASSRLLWLRRGLIALTVLVVFFPVLTGQFLYWDDHETIVNNPRLNPVSFSGVAHYWAHPHMSLYVPVTYTVWGALAAIAVHPALFHTASVLLHLLSAWLVFEILRLLLAADLPALLGALLFAVHPVQVESVAWISGGKDLLGGLLGLLAIYHYLRFAQSQTTPCRRLHYALASLALVAAMLAKPSAVTVPLIAAALDLLLLRRAWKRVALATAPWLVLAIPIIVIGKFSQPAGGIPATPLLTRPLIAADALTFYFAHLLAPIRLALDYGRSPQWALSQPAIGLIWLIPLAVAVLIAWVGYRHRWLAAGALAFLFALLPVLGLVPFEFQTYSTVADHYLYLAMFGVALVAAGILLRWRNGQLRAAAVVVLLVLAVRSYSYARVWRDSVTLFQHTLAANPDSQAAHMVLGFLAAQRGDAQQAMAYYNRALELRPADPLIHYNVGNILLRQNRPADALEHYQIAIGGAPGKKIETRNNYAFALALTGQLDAAIQQVQIALEIDPGSVASHLRMARLLVTKGDIADARQHYLEALRLQPGDPDAQRGLKELSSPSAGR